MFEKVNPSHPDKVADRIAGAMLDIAYAKQETPKVAIEVLVGHGIAHIIAESSYKFTKKEVKPIVERIAGKGIKTDLKVVPQDIELAKNQDGKIRCGDNGIFKGVPLTNEQKELAKIVKIIYEDYPSDGKYILKGKNLIVCQSFLDEHCAEKLREDFPQYKMTINPLGYWTGGVNVDCGATNRKLGSDMADSVTGGGLMGKDVSKADVSMNICAFLEAQETGKTVKYYCAIGDEEINGVPYQVYVDKALAYIRSLGGFEKFAEWGLV